MNEDVKKYLFDIQTSILAVEEYLGIERNFNIYQNNKMLKKPWSVSLK